MADSDPPHEVDDGEAPADRNGYAPDADALEEQVSDGKQHHHRQQEADAEANEPPIRGRTGQHDGADFFRDRAEGVARLYDRSAFRLDRRLVWLVHSLSLKFLKFQQIFFGFRLPAAESG